MGTSRPSFRLTDTYFFKTMDLTSLNTTTPESIKTQGQPIYVSEHQRYIAEIVIDLALSLVVSLVGTVTNLIVVIVFARQGFRDSVSISMSTVAFWDFLKCLGGAIQRMSGPMKLFDPALALSWSNISVVVFNYLISFTSYVTSVLAAYVAIERCLCVSVPFRVRKLLTPRVAFTACLTISVVVFGCFAVMYGIYDISWEPDPELFNRTVAHYSYNDFSVNNTALFEYYNISGIVWPLVSLVIIVVSTAIISHKLRQSLTFRSRQCVSSCVSSSSRLSVVSGRGVSQRDGQVVKVLLVVIAVYILTLSPRVVVYMVKYFVYDFYFLRRYHNLFVLTAYVVYFFDLVNGASGFFIFLVMSSSFRATSRRLFWSSPGKK
ncbi:hypothetical protein Btru_047326 [Bulinus truncatus]|nr:hypothetical protein Btru_047326 [Bulinus truncatus]